MVRGEGGLTPKNWKIRNGFIKSRGELVSWKSKKPPVIRRNMRNNFQI
jgi:hypothetical protein